MCYAKTEMETNYREAIKDNQVSKEFVSDLRTAKEIIVTFIHDQNTRYSPQAEAFAAELAKSLQPEDETEPKAPAAEETTIPPAEVNTDPPTEAFDDLAPILDEPDPAEDEETLTAEDMAAITGQEWTEEAMEQFRACC